ncbi:MAG TPA: integrase arm-type DNA-binding domain-containing protein [Xanthobacteraceae bacterium]|jgi:integrase|nr:integrase arm-type DNA-binding domain-containing protein [Xanthobacteraceae bacterium]
MPRALTTRTLETLKPGPNRREIADRLMPGLYLVLQPSGAKSWAVRYRHAGTPRKHTLGSYPAIDLKSARHLAGKALRTVAEGRDPGHERTQQRAAPNSVAMVAAQFIERHCKRSNRPRTARETQRLLDLHVLPRWRGRLLRDITRRDVLDLLDRVVDTGKPIAANRVFSAVRKMFNWALERDILAASPCAGVKPPSAERSRDRVLNDDELRRVWRAADKIGGPFGALLKLLTLTGQRRDEVARARWSEIDLDGRLWTLAPERVKNNQPHEVPLSEPAIAILSALPRITGAGFVLTTNGDAPSSNYAKNKRRLDALLPQEMPPFRLHDIRRSVASGMARLGINLPVIEKVLGHASGSFAGIVGVYQKHSFADEKRNALNAWGAFVADLVSDRPRRNVVRLHKGGGHA